MGNSCGPSTTIGLYKGVEFARLTIIRGCEERFIPASPDATADYVRAGINPSSQPADSCELVLSLSLSLPECHLLNYVAVASNHLLSFVLPVRRQTNRTAIQ